MRTTYRALIAAAALGVIAALPAAPAQASEPSSGIGINGSVVSLVSYEGKLMTFADYNVVSDAADAAGRAPILVSDGSAVSRGYVVAFDDLAEANAYTTSHRMGSIPSSARDAAAEAATAKAMAARQSAAVTVLGARGLTPLLGCSLPNHMGYLYVNASCGGDLLGVGWNDQVPDLRIYGKNDNISSMALGDCIAMLYGYKDIKYGGGSQAFGGGDVYTFLPAGWNDVISSYKTTPTGIC